MAEKIWTLVQKLSVASSKGVLNWERTAEEGVYQATFPGYTVQLFPRERDFVVRVLDEDGTLVEEVTDGDVQLMTPIGGPQVFDVLRDLYKLARRKAMGVDSALDTIIKSLDERNDEL